MNDTSPAGSARYHELLRAMPPERRLEAAMRLSRGVRALAMLGYRVPALVSKLGSDFEVDQPILREALSRGGSANIFHLPMVTKVDIFGLGNSPYDVVEVIRIRGAQLEDMHLDSWASRLDLAQLLARARSNAAQDR